MSKWGYAALAALLAYPSVAAQSVPRAGNSPAAGVKDVLDALIETSSSVVAFEQNGVMTARTDLRIRVNTVAGVEQAGTVAVPYSREDSTVTIHHVRVRKPNGVVLETPPAGAIDMPADATQAAPTFTDLYVKNVNVQALQPGDLLEYAFSVRRSSVIAGQFWFETQFTRGVPVLEETLEVSIPTAANATVKSAPGFIPVVTTNAGRQTYRWRHSNPTVLDANAAAVSAHARRDIRADVQVTSFRDWAALGSAIQDLWKDRAAVTPAIREKARELTGAATSDTEKAEVLYRFVATGIRYVAVNMGVGRLRPHTAAEVLAAGFGDCKDKHTLLVALLASVGLEADAALIGPGATIDPDVPSPSQFSHVITAIRVPNGPTAWADTTLEVAPYGFLIDAERDARVLRVPSSGSAALVKTPAEPTRPSVWRTETTGTVNDQGRLTATVRETFTGDAEFLMRAVYRRLPAARWADFMKELPLGKIFRGTVSDVTTTPPEDTSGPFRVEYRYSIESLSNWAGRSVYPPAAIEFPDVPGVDRPSVPLALGPPTEIVAIARIEFPPNIQARLPTGVAPTQVLERDVARYDARVSVEGQTVSVERRWTTKAREVAMPDVAAYRAFVADVEAARYNVSLTVVQPWAWSQTANIDWYQDADPATTKILQNAAVVARRRDYQEALATIREVLRTEPDSEPAWQMQAYVELESGARERGLDTLRRRAAVTKAAHLLKYFATRLTAFLRHGEALTVWEQVHRQFPDDRDAPLYLGEALNRAARHSDATAVLEPERGRQGNSARFHTTLGRAYLGAGRVEEGTVALKRSADLDASASNLNNVAWDLVERNLALADARAYSERAVNLTTDAVNALEFSKLDATGIRQMTSIAAQWDTLGWVMFRQGETDRAEAYLSAAWSLTQGSASASHLAELYAAQKDLIKAGQFETFATAGSPGLGLPPMASTTPEAAARAARITASRAELSRLRTFSVPRPTGGQGSADVLVQVGSGGQVTDARFIKGDERLRGFATPLRGVTLTGTAPGLSLTRSFRRGILSCTASPSCSLVLLSVNDVTSVE